MKENETVIIKGIQHFIEILNELEESYPSHVFTDAPPATKFLFRGVGTHHYPLLPSILRETVTDVDGRKITNKKYTAYVNETAILKDFIGDASGVVHGIPATDLHRWAEYAQHFGVPTRFLDWTSNPLTALYFACAAAGEENPAVWILNLNNYSRYKSKMHAETHDMDSMKDMTLSEVFNQLLSGKKAIDYPTVYRPYYVDARMSAQSSYFMVWGNKPDPFEILMPPECWMKLSNMDANGVRSYGSDQERGVLIKFEIYNDRKQEIMRQLDLMGINDKTLFPGLDGIGKYIERKYRFDYFEALEKF